ncbi:MAG: hypothetical protein P4L51_01845 [Puia sp.]|nr:hypothetical protein [Puia sp.]
MKKIEARVLGAICEIMYSHSKNRKIQQVMFAIQLFTGLVVLWERGLYLLLSFTANAIQVGLMYSSDRFNRAKFKAESSLREEGLASLEFIPENIRRARLYKLLCCVSYLLVLLLSLFQLLIVISFLTNTGPI